MRPKIASIVNACERRARCSWFVLVAILLAGGGGIGGCGGASQSEIAPQAVTAASERRYRATIHWTSYGIPHIVADDFASLGFGQGYAAASQRICLIADQVIKLRSQRARYFGPHASTAQSNANLDTDFAYLALDLRRRAERALAETTFEIRDLFRGYAAGYNHFLARTGRSGLPHPCRDSEWVVAIDAVDVMARVLDWGILASSGATLERIGAAKPEAHLRGDMHGGRENIEPMADRIGDDADAAHGPWPTLRSGGASNAWAIGAELSAGGGLLMANPHLPWHGALLFSESHLIIPGRLDVYGATIAGTPLLFIGFNEHLGWTHTVSRAPHATIYRLALDPANPTRYRYGDSYRDMETEDFVIQVRRDDGELIDEQRTLYRSHYGPMLADQTRLRWRTDAAFTIKDAAESIEKMPQQYLAMLRARNLQQFQAAMSEYHSTPFVCTIYADRDGNAWFIDSSRVPELSGLATQAWLVALKTVPPLARAWRNRLLVLDGSTPMFALRGEDAYDGSIGPANVPQLLRRDMVAHANGSPASVYPETAVTLRGFSPLYGPENAALSPRTRMNWTLLREMAEDGQIDVAEMKEAFFANRSLTAELLRTEVVERCRYGARRRAQIAPLCDTLAAWDGRYHGDRVGALLWREFIATYLTRMPEDEAYAQPFSPERPIATPRGLPALSDAGASPASSSPATQASVVDDPVMVALETAAMRLRQAGIDPLRDLLVTKQFFARDDERVFVPGGGEYDGVINIAQLRSDRNRTLLSQPNVGAVIHKASGLTERGYPVDYGTSFLMMVQFSPNGPTGYALMPYGASSDPQSPHRNDQYLLYQKNSMRPIQLRIQDIERDPNHRVEVLSALQ